MSDTRRVNVCMNTSITDGVNNSTGKKEASAKRKPKNESESVCQDMFIEESSDKLDNKGGRRRMKKSEANDSGRQEIMMDECMMEMKKVSNVEKERVKSGMKGVYIVCEDLQNCARKVWIEYAMKNSVN